MTLSNNPIQTKICNFFLHLKLYLSDKGTKKIFSVFSLINLILFVKYKHIYKLMPTMHSKKVGTEACLPVGNITSSFNYTNNLGTEDINCFSLAGGIFALLGVYKT